MSLCGREKAVVGVFKNMMTECGVKLHGNANTPALHVNVVRSGGGNKKRWYHMEIPFLVREEKSFEGKNRKIALLSFRCALYIKFNMILFSGNWNYTSRMNDNQRFPIESISPPDHQLSNVSSGLPGIAQVGFLRALRHHSGCKTNKQKTAAVGMQFRSHYFS